MRIAKIRVANFRSILDATLECGPLTILIGCNGAGKSSFLQALRMFMETSTSFVPTNEDFYNRDQTKEILIEVTFCDLANDEKAEFKSYLDKNETLVVQKRFPGGEYYGQTFGCAELEPVREKIRQKASKVSDHAQVLKSLVDTGKFPGLQAVTRNIDEELKRWEGENVSRCSQYFRAGEFQGPQNIAGGKVKGRTQFVYIPPVREADLDASGVGKQTPLGALVTPLLTAMTERNADIAKVKAEVQKGYDEYRTMVQGAGEKETLEKELTSVLRRYDQETSATVQLQLDPEIPLPPPKPSVWLKEDGFDGEVSRKGHGLQRLFIFSILELYEKSRKGPVDNGEGKGILLAIEEPELYQHPARSRAISRIFKELCFPQGKTNFPFQILLTTHSPYFIDLEKFDGIRRIEKADSGREGPMQTVVHKTDLKIVGQKVTEALGEKTEVTDSSAWARMRANMGLKGSEALFAEGIILVEGVEDEAILSACADHHKVSLDAEGIAILPVEGKNKLPWLLVLCRELNIKTYTIFDADIDKVEKKKEKEKDKDLALNNGLLKLLGHSPNRQLETLVTPAGCVWKTNFADEVKADFGEAEWESAFKKACDEFGIEAARGKKKFALLYRTAETLLSSGKQPAQLEKLWSAISQYFNFPGMKSPGN